VGVEAGVVVGLRGGRVILGRVGGVESTIEDETPWCWRGLGVFFGLLDIA